MRFTSLAAEEHYVRLRKALPDALLAFDFDGTLAPIVGDPTRAYIDPEVYDALAALAGRTKAVSIVTGRPIEPLLELSGLDQLADGFLAAGTELELRGHYGQESWSARHRELVSSDPPPGLAPLCDRLPRVLQDQGVTDAFIEDKHLSVAVHTRRSAQPELALARLREPLSELARQFDMVCVPGRLVIEIKGQGKNKLAAMEELISDLAPKAVSFAGDDLGDIPAFQALSTLTAETGIPTLRVCSASTEEQVLVGLADLVCEGPAEIAVWLRALCA